jgi:Microcystin-dependent protein
MSKLRYEKGKKQKQIIDEKKGENLMNDNCYLGTIELFAFTFAPYGWLLCDGSLLSTSKYPKLYQLIKGTYGGDGITNYQLPNLVGIEPYPHMMYYIYANGEAA